VRWSQRRRRRWAHQSTSDGGVAMQRQRKTHVTWALEHGGELESEARGCGGGGGPQGFI
jgi:hypothetical protein